MFVEYILFDFEGRRPGTAHSSPNSALSCSRGCPRATEVEIAEQSLIDDVACKAHREALEGPYFAMRSESLVSLYHC